MESKDLYACVCVSVLFSYLYTGLNILVLIHDWQNGLHAAMFNQVWLIPHKDQWYPAEKPLLLHYKAATIRWLISWLAAN